MTSYCVVHSSSTRRAIPNAKLCMGCPDIRGGSESGLHLARGLSSRVKPVEATMNYGSRPSSLECSLTENQTVTAQQTNQASHSSGVAQEQYPS